MDDKLYYLIIFSDTNKPEVYSYCNETKFNHETIRLFKDRWDSKHYPYESTIVSEINQKSTKNNTPSSFFEHEDRCPSCGEKCNVEIDLDENDCCNDCRP